MSATHLPEERAVFLNVPFDSSYQPLFLAIVMTLVSIGRRPRCVLEIAETGQGRLRRLISHIERCKVSLHDLSRVCSPPRFNMPFELGLAFAIRDYAIDTVQYRFVLLESQPYRLSRTLSDLSGHDPYIHNSKPIQVISAVLDALGKPTASPSPEDVYSVWRQLMKVSRSLMRAHGAHSVYTRTLFRRVVAAAALLATREGLISR